MYGQSTMHPGFTLTTSYEGALSPRRHTVLSYKGIRCVATTSAITRPFTYTWP